MNEVFEKIESLDFSIQVNLASGLSMAQTIVRSSDEWHDLRYLSGLEIIERIEQILRDQEPLVTECKDAALFTYILALARLDPVKLQKGIAAITASKEYPSLRWTHQIIEQRF